MKLTQHDIAEALHGSLAVSCDVAAAALNLSKDAVRRAVKRGELESTGVGRKICVPTSALRKRLGLPAQNAA
jgi:excisionase family DNA binding protein